MAKCSRTRIPRRKICAGDLRHSVRLLRREQLPAGIDDDEPQIRFTLIARAKMGIKTTSIGTALFDGINIEDRPTHTFIARSTNTTNNVDDGNTFIAYDGRFFRIIRRTIVDEDRRYVSIEARERGDIEKSASEA